jgi:hypothetical protein
MGQKRPNLLAPVRSVLPPTTDIEADIADVSDVPLATERRFPEYL